ncbi:MAG: YesL family protein [Anaerobacillus sp.]|uniref:YesL family protein n=1 Tax=Anaerobacillus sp. TaxID=1872506 RepID=UPI003919AB49
MKIAYLNLLWIIFTVIGLFIFGVFPASVALLSVIRKWLMKDADIPIFKSFFLEFKKEFIRSNIFGFIFIVAAAILYTNFSYILHGSGPLQGILTIGLIINGFIFLITFIYFFPVYVHYKLKFREYFKHSFLMGLINIHHFLLICFLFFTIYHLFIYFPVYVGLFLPSMIGLTVMSITLISFNNFEKKKSVI